MKIGILTLPLHDNYGGILQAVALYRLLHSQGHDVILINKQTYNKQVFWKKLIKKVLLKIPFHNFQNLKTNHERLKKIKFHKPFIEKEIFKISEDLYTKEDLETFVKRENLDAVIVGSDQVWRKTYINGKYYKNYFLDFVDGSKIKKIAYAASFGTNNWEGEGDEEDILNLLKDFTAISTREKSGVDICKNIFSYEGAKHVLDPTLIISKDFYQNEILSKYDANKVQKVELLTYILDEEIEKKEIINYVKNNLSMNSVNHLKGFTSTKTIYSIPEWLTSFVNTDFVVTDSFHGMIFSIIFEKDFMVIGNKSRGLDRFINLLSMLGLEDKLIFNVENIKNKKLSNIDYKRVNQILDENKKISFNYLIKSLDYNNSRGTNI